MLVDPHRGCCSGRGNGMVPNASIGLDIDQTKAAGVNALTELELEYVGRNRLRAEKGLSITGDCNNQRVLPVGSRHGARVEGVREQNCYTVIKWCGSEAKREDNNGTTRLSATEKFPRLIRRGGLS